MTDAEPANDPSLHRDNPRGAEADLDEIAVEIVHPATVSMSFRLSAQDASAIRRAAEQAGMTVSGWIRRACATAAAGAQIHAPMPHQRISLAKVFRLLDELNKELRRLVAQAEQLDLVTRDTDGSTPSGPYRTEE